MTDKPTTEVVKAPPKPVEKPRTFRDHAEEIEHARKTDLRRQS